jgi:fumarate reductase flavoprotein subunit
MKRSPVLLFAAAALVSAALAAASCAGSAKAPYAAGAYEGVGEGHGGEIRVSVVVTDSRIEKIQVLSQDETPMIGDAAIEELTAAVINANSTGVDAVSGASESSAGFLAAVEDALSKAGAVPAALPVAGKKAAKVSIGKQYDIVVIGAGGAGLSAALSASQSGAAVAVFEKMAMVGGNTLRATGGLNAAGTPYQQKAGIADTAELMYKDTMKGGYEKNDPSLVKVLSEKAAASVEWIASLGGDLSDVGRLAGASVNRAHRPAGGGKVGPEIATTLYDAVKKVPSISVFTKTRVVEITLDKAGAASGVVVLGEDGKSRAVKAKAVIIASGGFGANNEMAASLVPSLKGFATTNHPGATGDGILMAEKAGAALVDMKEIQTHPTYAPGKEMITEAVRGNGAILVNKAGDRFIDELATRDVVSAAILAQEGKTSYLVFESSVRKSLKAIEDYVKLGIVVEGATPAELAAKIGADPAKLAATIDGYNGFVAAKKDGAFGRADLPRALSTAPYYAIEVLPAVHHTMGGVKIDTETRVLKADGSRIAGLYAAGEVAGGVHGGNRLGGNALADVVTFGRIAGAAAAAGR